MSNRKIIKEAIEKAIEGGWSGVSIGLTIWREPDGKVKLKSKHTLAEWAIEEIIFDHGFAKALWGDTWKEDCKVCGFTHYMYDKDQYDDEQADPYIYHLQQMIISDNPIKYLGNNI